MRLTIIQKLVAIVGISILFTTVASFSLRQLDFLYFVICFLLILTTILSTAYVVIIKLIQNPIQSLVHATQKISQGDYNYQLPLGRQDELGQLADSFHQMIDSLKRSTVTHQQLLTILENMVNSVIVVNSTMTIEMVNNATCAILGYTREELIGQPMSIIFDSQAKEQRVPEHVCRWVNKNGFIFGMEETYVSKYQRQIPVVLSASAMRDGNNKLKGIVCVAIDNTEHKRIENQLRQTNKELIANENKLRQALSQVQQSNMDLKQTQAQLLQNEKLASIGHLAAGIAHEINNPVGFINSNLQTLQDYIGQYARYFTAVQNLKQTLSQSQDDKSKDMILELDELQKELNLDFINDDVDNLLNESLTGTDKIKRIVADLRTFARADKDAMDSVNIEDIVDSIISIVNNEVKYKARVIKDYSKVPLVRGNTQRLGQVFINLIINAAQSIADHGNIEIKTYEDNGMAVVSIKDSGCGIEKENLNKIFDPFFTTKPVGQGTGLGLSISYDIIKKHEGQLLVESTLGVGTTFIVKLPMAYRKDNV